jgi:uncharacterized lipoprotein YajG
VFADEHQEAFTMKRFFLMLGLATLLTLLTACAAASNTGNSTSQNPTVMMGATTFETSTITHHAHARDWEKRGSRDGGRRA